MKPSRSRLKFVSVLAALVAVRVLYNILFGAPSEAAMIAKFHQQRARFEELRTMIQHDWNVTTIGPDWVQTFYSGTIRTDGKQKATDLSSKRVELYRSRLSHLGFKRIDSYDGHVQLEQFGGGFADTTWGIGYIWCATPPTPLVASAYHEMPGKYDRVFSRLDGNWYLYHRR